MTFLDSSTIFPTFNRYHMKNPKNNCWCKDHTHTQSFQVLWHRVTLNLKTCGKTYNMIYCHNNNIFFPHSLCNSPLPFPCRSYCDAFLQFYPPFPPSPTIHAVMLYNSTRTEDWSVPVQIVCSNIVSTSHQSIWAVHPTHSFDMTNKGPNLIIFFGETNSIFILK